MRLRRWFVLSVIMHLPLSLPPLVPPSACRLAAGAQQSLGMCHRKGSHLQKAPAPQRAMRQSIRHDCCE